MSGPRYQHFTDLDVSRYNELKSDIEQKGVLVPIIVDENDRVLDGHQRRRICAELHIECPRIVMPGLSEDEKHVLAIVVNAFRRHLTGPARSQAVGHLSQLGWSTRRIAEAVGVNHSTIVRDQQKSGGADAPPENVDPETGEILSGHGSVEEHDADPGSQADQTATPSAGGEDRGETDTPSPRPTRKVTGKDGKTYAVKPRERHDPAPTSIDIVCAVDKAIVAFGDKLEQRDAVKVAQAFAAEGQRDRLDDFISRLRSYADALSSALSEATKVKAV